MNDTWASPHPSRLQLSNCTAAADWASLYWRYDDTGLNHTIQMVRIGLISYFHDFNVSDPGDSELARWIAYWEGQKRGMVLGRINDYAAEHCLDQVCPRLGWQGLPDLAGLGMLTNYYLQAILVTLYVAVLLTLQYTTAGGWMRKRTCVWRIYSAIQHSLRLFLDASLIFALAVLVATVHTFRVRLTAPRTPLTDYALYLFIYLSHYTLLPALALHHCNTSSLRRHYGRIALWSLATSLELAALGMFFRIVRQPGSYEFYRVDDTYTLEDPDRQLPWDAWCTNAPAVRTFSIWALALIGFTLLMMILPVLLFASRRWIDQTRKETCQKTLVITCLAAMWAFQIEFTLFRIAMNKRAGSSNKDSQWSFGQILALASWIPVVVEIVYISCEGPEKALLGHLVEPYEVKKKLEDAEMIESGRGDEFQLLPHRQTLISAIIGPTQKEPLETVTQGNSMASDRTFIERRSESQSCSGPSLHTSTTSYDEHR